MHMFTPLPTSYPCSRARETPTACGPSGLRLRLRRRAAAARRHSLRTRAAVVRLHARRAPAVRRQEDERQRGAGRPREADNAARVVL
jgi:hypothetical protein